jgi:hypothetical protein
MISGSRSALAYNVVSKPPSKLYRSVTVINIFSYSGEADEDQRKVLKGMTEVAKEKETGALNESAESIKVMPLLRFCAALID